MSAQKFNLQILCAARWSAWKNPAIIPLIVPILAWQDGSLLLLPHQSYHITMVMLKITITHLLAEQVASILKVILLVFHNQDLHLHLYSQYDSMITNGISLAEEVLQRVVVAHQVAVWTTEELLYQHIILM